MHCVPVCVWLPVTGRPTHPTGLVHTSTLVPSRTTRCVAFAYPFLAFLPCYAFVSQFWEWYVWRD